MDKQTKLVGFPFLGLDLSRSPDEQRPGTTPFGVNVRAYDVGNRKRGGSRSGLNPLFGRGNTEQVNGFNRIQSLTCISRVSPAATIDSTAIVVNFDIHYSESNNPPVRDSPVSTKQLTWYRGTIPTREYVTEAIVGTPDGGGTGKGTATFKISYDGTTVTLVCTFGSAGFPGPYFFSGRPQSFTMTLAGSIFFNHLAGMSSNWTVVAGSFIGNYFFNCYYPVP